MRHDLVNPVQHIVRLGEHLVFILWRQRLQTGLVLRLVIRKTCEIMLSVGSLEYSYWENVSIFLELPLFFISEPCQSSNCHALFLRRSLPTPGCFVTVSTANIHASG